MRDFSLSPFPSLPVPRPSAYRHVRLAIIVVAYSDFTVDDSGRHPETHQDSHGMCHVQKTQDQGVSDTLSRQFMPASPRSIMSSSRFAVR
jgi:hypothetical protein